MYRMVLFCILYSYSNKWTKKYSNIFKIHFFSSNFVSFGMDLRNKSHNSSNFRSHISAQKMYTDNLLGTVKNLQFKLIIYFVTLLSYFSS